ncbi:MAG: outer membrane protein transport protein [Nitrospira sp.]|nr:outer membrane protein transport protein [Nitrospira sp.]HNP29024.1 outer membrane protein transport protein [Nitrospirales bacterium]
MACFLVITDTAYGEAFRIQDQSASATGQGSAFAAQADDPSAIHYNPAGMTGLERVQVSIGTNLISSHVDFKSVSGTNVNGGIDGTVANPPPSNFFLTANLKDLGFEAFGDLSLGIGLTSPYGIQVKYSESSQLGQLNSFAALPLIDIKPTIAYKVNQYLSLGAGLDIYTFSILGETQAEQKLTAGPEWAFPPLNGLGITPGAKLEANGTDTAVGFNISLMLTPWRNPDLKPRLNLAFVYRNQVSLNLKGKLLVDGAEFADASTELNLPQIFSGGIALWPIRDNKKEWKVEVDVDYVDWTSFKNLDLELDSIASLPGARVTIPSERNYDSAVIVVFGTEYKWISPSDLPDWDIAIRGGFSHSETPVPKKTFSPSVPDADSNTLSFGAGFICRKNGRFFTLFPCGGNWVKAIAVDLAFQTVFFETRKIRSTNDPLQRVNGNWENNLYVGALNLRLNF